MKINNKHVKKNKTIKAIKKFFFLTLVYVVIIGLGVYGTFKASEYVASLENSNYKRGYSDGFEIGHLRGLEEGAENADLEIKSRQEASRQSLLKQLAKLESRGIADDVRLDTNGQYSYGLYHFQIQTVKDLYRRYYDTKITTQQAIDIALDPELSTRLAYDAVFVKKELRHWLISMCKLKMITKGCLNQKQINQLYAKK